MATIDYKEKYEQAMERARQFFEKPYLEDSAGIVKYIFPEFAESEDERIRKSIIELLNEVHFTFKYYDINKMLAWLEKQGKSIDINPSEFDLRLNKLLKQFETLPKEELVSSLSFYLNVVQNDGTCKDEEKQCEQKLHIEKLPFETKTPEESLGIDSDTYSKIVDKCVYGEPKQEWGEEDEKMVKDIIAAIDTLYYHGMVNWLKSLKDRIVPQPKQEWSEEDGEMFDAIIADIQFTQKAHNHEVNQVVYEREIDWLKSLKDRYTWKPSDEQMEYLAKAIATLGDEGNCKTASILNDLRVELKKLRE